MLDQCQQVKSQFAIIIDIDIGVVNRIITHMDEHIDHSLLERREKHRGLYVAAVTPMIRDVVERLLSALQLPVESGVLGKGLVYELLFRIMCGENAAVLYALAMRNSNVAKIEKALKLIHSRYNSAMNVDSLAALVNMSPSAFHRAFNDVTTSSPIQYIKKIRLTKARDLLLEQRDHDGETVIGWRWLERRPGGWREPASGKEVFAPGQLPPEVELQLELEELALDQRLDGPTWRRLRADPELYRQPRALARVDRAHHRLGRDPRRQLAGGDADLRQQHPAAPLAEQGGEGRDRQPIHHRGPEHLDGIHNAYPAEKTNRGSADVGIT